MLGLMKPDGCMALLNILYINLQQRHNYVNELILATFSPLATKCKKLNGKKLWKCIFRASTRTSFSYFPNTTLDHEDASLYLLELPWIILQYLVQALCNI